MPTIIDDGDMELGNVTKWSLYNSCAVTKNTDSPHSGTFALRVTHNGGDNNPGVMPTRSGSNLIAPSGHKIRLVGWARGDGTKNPLIYEGSTRWSGTSSTSWQPIDVTWNISANRYIVLRFFSTTATTWVEFDDLTVYNLTAASIIYKPFFMDRR